MNQEERERYCEALTRNGDLERRLLRLSRLALVALDEPKRRRELRDLAKQELYDAKGRE